MPRFVLLRHECPPTREKPSHWDFMLEADGVLRTWELRELPTVWAVQLGAISFGGPSLGGPDGAATVNARQLPDHRLAYLDYEGPLTADRGRVRCCDRGTYSLEQERRGTLRIQLSGTFLTGAACLTFRNLAWTLESSGEDAVE